MAKLTVGNEATIIPKLIGEIDNIAEQARLRIVSPGSGQAMTYQSKFEEAKAFKAGTAEATPWLSSEAEATGQTVAQVADNVIAARQQWESVGVHIEAARLKAKKAVRSAPDRATAHAAVSDFKIQMAKIQPTG